jgi:hypothetical protein
MGEFILWNWIVVLGTFFGLIFVWGYPLSTICRRAGKPAAVGWVAGSIGLLFLGPLWCIWWLALTRWQPPETKR